MKMNMPAPVFVNSKITGGHWAMQTSKSVKPFENPMDINTKIKLFPDDIVVDIGAYVGEYSRWAIRSGVKQVFCYEPTPYTFKILELNKLPGMNIFNLAVVGNDAPFVNLFISRGIGVTNSVVKKDKKAGFIGVPAIRYEDAVKIASVVKIDIEGGEYTLNIIQPQLRAIILEFHPIANAPWRQWCDRIMDDIMAAGYKSYKIPNFKSGWNLTGCWAK